MADARKSFLLYESTQELIDMLPDADAGQLIKAVFAYEANGTEPEGISLPAMLVFTSIRQYLDRNREAYEAKSATNTENGAKGGRPRKTENNRTEPTETENNREKPNETENNRTVFEENRTEPTETLFDNDNDKDSFSEESKKEEAEDVAGVIYYLNAYAGTHYSESDPEAVKLIRNLFRRGYTAEDLERVVRRMTMQWHGTDMACYLRPCTLFGKKFDSYLGRSVREDDVADDLPILI